MFLPWRSWSSIIIALLLVASTSFGAKPVDSTAWTAIPVEASALPPGILKAEVWKSTRSDCVVTITRASGLHDPKEAIACAIGMMSPLYKAGVYPTRIYRDADCSLPNIAMNGLLPNGDQPCRIQAFFGTKYVQVVTILRIPRDFVSHNEFDLNDTAATAVAEKINAYADEDHSKQIAEMQELVNMVRSVKTSKK